MPLVTAAKAGKRGSVAQCCINSTQRRAFVLDSTKVAIWCIFLSFFLIYALYDYETRRVVEKRQTAASKYVPGGRSNSKSGSKKGEKSGQTVDMSSIKNIDFLAEIVPEIVIEKSKLIHVAEHYVDVTDVRLFYREARPTGNTLGTVLLLHGQAFSSQDWLDIRTPLIFAAAGYHTVAVDLPGYGNTGGNAIYSSSKGAFVLDIISTLNLGRPVVVSPSMSGSFALPVLIHHADALAGYVPVAPVGTNDYSEEDYARTQVPTLILYGSRDTSLGTNSVSNLRALPVSKVVRIPDAGHACYLNQPDVFHGAVLRFLDAVHGMQ